MDDLIGKVLDRYEVVECIGVGGMATVYKAIQPTLDRVVAIKVLPPHFLHDDTFVQRFQREARSIAQLSHPNILPVYDSGRVGDLFYVAMQYISNGTLKDRIEGPMDLRHASRVLNGMAGALDFAHSRGIIHRDVKPTNVLLGEREWPFLADFGIAKLMDQGARLTKTGAGIGTPEYMSPEQAQGGGLDGRSDLYSLGAVLFEMVTGEPPFRGDTALSVVFKHVYEPVRTPSTLNPECTPAMDAIVLKALAKSPDDRFQTGEEMAEAFAEAVAALGLPPLRLTASMPSVRPAISDPPTGEAAPKVNPSLEPMYQEAKQLFDAQEWTVSIDKLRSLHSVDPQYRDVEQMLNVATTRVAQAQSLDTLYGAALRHIGQNQLEDAATSLRRVVAVDPAFRDATPLLANVEQSIRSSRSSLPVVPEPVSAGGAGRSRIGVFVAVAALALVVVGAGAAFAAAAGGAKAGAPPEATPTTAAPTALAIVASSTAVPTVTPIPEPTAAATPEPTVAAGLPAATATARPAATAAPTQAAAATATPQPAPTATQPPVATSTANPLFQATNTPAPSPTPGAGGNDGGGGTRR